MMSLKTGICFIVALVLTCIGILIRDLIVSKKANKRLEEKLKRADELAKKREEQIKEEQELFQGILNQKNKLKVDADEEKRKIRTGNHYDNYLNGLNKLRDDSEEGTATDSKH